MAKIYSLGVMTGTSCDGADVAALELTKLKTSWIDKLLYSENERFPDSLRTKLKVAQQGQLKTRENAIVANEYSTWIANLLIKKLKKWKLPQNRVTIAIHGQTVWHEPEQHISVQLIDPTIISYKTGCTVTSGFRQPDLARNGEGAPLVPYYHWMRSEALSDFSKLRPFSIHNIGGIANLTYITKKQCHLKAFDTGPGNALIDLAVEQLTNSKEHFDRNGNYAAKALSKINWTKIKRLTEHTFFKKCPPKSTGKELFNQEFLSKLPGSGLELVANSTAFTAFTMARAYTDFVLRDKSHKLNAIFIAGGGAKNKTLLTLFEQQIHLLTERKILVTPLPNSFAPVEALEAMAFARLGFEALQGGQISLKTITGASEDAYGAGIFPGKNFRALLESLKMI